MRTFIKIIIAYIFCGLTGVVKAQDPCMEELKGYYTKIKDLTINGFISGKTTYVDYTIRMTPVDKKEKEQCSTIQVWVNSRDTKLVNDKMQILKNEKEAFTILPEQRMIVISDAIPIAKDHSSNNMLW